MIGLSAQAPTNVHLGSFHLLSRRTYTPEGHHRDQNALTRFTVPVLWKVIERDATYVDILMYRDMLTLSPGA